MNSRLHRHVLRMAEGSHGGFAAKLADAWLTADSSNQAALKKAFPDLLKAPPPSFGEYKAFVRRLADAKVKDDDFAQTFGDWVDQAKELADAETLP